MAHYTEIIRNFLLLLCKKIAFLATDGFEQSELTQPWKEIKAAGAEVALISLKKGEIQGMNHAEKGDKFKVDHTVDEVRADGDVGPFECLGELAERYAVAG